MPTQKTMFGDEADTSQSAPATTMFGDAAEATGRTSSSLIPTGVPGVPKPPLPDINSVKPPNTPGGAVTQFLNDLTVPGSSLKPAPQPTTMLGKGLGFINSGITKLGHVPLDLAANKKAAAAADALEGLGTIYAPEALPAVAAAPLTAAGATAGGLAGSAAGGAIARHFDASPDVERLSSDVGAIPGAILGGKGTQLAGRAVAEGAMNSAVGAGIRAKGFGARPGYGALTETNGIRPSAMQESAEQRISDINGPYEARIASAPPVSLDRPRAVMNGLINNTRNPETVAGAKPFQQSLYGNRVTGDPYGKIIPASEALDVKRNLGDIVNWRPQEQIAPAQGAGRSAYGELGDVIHEAAPGTKDLATRMHNLIPFAKRAGMADLNAGPIETGFNRATRPTGGLLPAMLAAGRFGPVGAVSELAGQEALGQPAVKAAIARILWRGVGGERLGVPEMPTSPLTADVNRGRSLGPGAVTTPPSADRSGSIYNPRNNPMEPTAQRALPPSTAPYSGSEGRGGVNVPDIISNSSRGEGTPYRLIEAPAPGQHPNYNKTIDYIDPRSREILAPGPATHGWLPNAPGQSTPEPGAGGGGAVISKRGEAVPNTPNAIQIPPEKTNPKIRVRNQ